VTDHQTSEAVNTVGGLLLGEASGQEGSDGRFDEVEGRSGDRRSRPYEQDRVGVAQQRLAKGAGERTDAVVPWCFGAGKLDFAVDAFDQAVEERGLVGYIVIDGHRVDAQFGSQPSHGQSLKPLLVDDLQCRRQDLIA